MVDAKKKAAPRARIAHKLARYFRAAPNHLAGVKGPNAPSTTHLRIAIITQASVVPLPVDCEMPIKPGTPLTTRRRGSREPVNNLSNPRADGASSPAQLSSFSLAKTEVAESLC